MTGASLSIDHALWGGRDLDALVTAFADLGLAPVAGGEHQHDVTHNALLGFDDGTYVELIAPREPGAETEARNAFFQGEAGPCGWAVATPDIGAESERLRDRGVVVDGPSYHERETPDGDWIEWEVAYPGGGEPGRTLPFLIQDHTPRDRRVQPSPSVAGSPLTGVVSVAIAVSDLDAAVSDFRRCYDLDPPDRASIPPLELELATFADAPLLLSAPSTRGSWLRDRLDRFGDLPWAILLGSAALDRAVERYDLVGEEDWPGGRLAWFPIDSPTGGRLGVIEAA